MKRIDFLRKMRADLGLSCTDKQLTNGFSSFLSKYKDIKEDSSSSGSGIDPEKDKTLEKGR